MCLMPSLRERERELPFWEWGGGGVHTTHSCGVVGVMWGLLMHVHVHCASTCKPAGRVEDEGHVFVAELEGEAAGRVVALAHPLTVALMCEYSKVKEQKGARTDAPGARVEMWVC